MEDPTIAYWFRRRLKPATIAKANRLGQGLADKGIPVADTGALLERAMDDGLDVIAKRVGIDLTEK